MKSIATVHVHVPQDLIEQILLRLPVGSVWRLRSVCKSWFSLISDPQFAKSHFDLAAAPTQRLLLWDQNFEDSEFPVKLVDIESNSESGVYDIPNPNPLPDYVVGSCRGFVLLSDTIYSDFIIWNPSTGFQKRFNKVVFRGCPSLCGIGYDSLRDDYVVVTVTLSHCETFNICCFSSRTNSWSYFCGNVGHSITNIANKDGSFLNGALHWLIYSFDTRRYTIVAFHVIEKSFFEIPWLHDLETSYSPFLRYNLSKIGGCLCLSFEHQCTTEIWIMNEYKVQSSWTKYFVFPYPFFYVIPSCFSKNDQILGCTYTTLFTRLDNKGNLLKYQSYGKRYHILQRGLYRESLLSLPTQD